jgi:hypothetical protein
MLWIGEGRRGRSEEVMKQARGRGCMASTGVGLEGEEPKATQGRGAREQTGRDPRGNRCCYIAREGVNIRREVREFGVVQEGA